MPLKHPDKTSLVTQLVTLLSEDLQQAEQAAQQAMEGAIHDQSKAETQYDTLGLEHAYLAEGQSRRIDELIKSITLLKHMTLTELTPDDAIILGAIINVKETSGLKSQTLFLAASGGGKKLTHEGKEIVVITPYSPLGEELLGRYEEDEFKWPNGQSGCIVHIF